MRRDCMLELQEAPENMLFCLAEVCHLGTTGRPAEHRDKPHDQQLAKVVTRVVSSRIGDVIEGGEENVHAGNGLQKGDPRPRIHPTENRKTLRSVQIPNAIPLLSMQPLTDLILETFRLNGALLAAGDRLLANPSLTSARWQVLRAVGLTWSRKPT